MYMSRVEIDIENRRKLRDLTHLGAYHSWVEDSFPDEKDEKIRSRKLWRIDTIGHKKYLLVVSREAPDLKCLEKYGVEGTAETRDYDSYLSALREGNLYRFRAVLNPSHSVKPDKGEKRGKVYPEVTAEQQIAYIEKKAAKNGFELAPDSYDITERGYAVLNKAGQRSIRLCRVAYEGILKVTDEEVFRKALCNGIGRKKAYGFGLLTVIRADGR